MAKRTQNKSLSTLKRALSGGIPQPRPRTRISRMDTGGATVSSKYVFGSSNTDGAGTWVGAYKINPASYSGADAGGTVLVNYQEYTLRSWKHTFTPSVGTTTPGVLWIGYYDNPEVMYKVDTGVYSVATLLALAKQSPISSSAPIWHPQTLNIPMSKRRKHYSTNSTNPGSVADADLQIHGVVIMAVEGTPTDTPLGNVSFEYTAVGFHLENNTLTGI